MKKIALASLLLQSALAFGQPAPKPYGVTPSAAQLNWHTLEMYCIIHYGVDTYTDKEWGFGDEDPKLINPAKFDAAQIVQSAKDGGFKGIVMVAKHHDGLCLWPTKTTEHNISKAAWKNGKGDMVKEYQMACEKLGMQLGLYCSPWDRNNAFYGKPEYLKIYQQQLRELYSTYGKLFISWHDGANGGDGYYGGANEARKIDRTTYYDWQNTWAITRKMQPGATIFGDVGPDVRWVGNEEGHAGETSWATYTPKASQPGKQPANGEVLYELGIEGTRNGKYWMPAECDVPFRPGWFYHASQDGMAKSPYTLLDLYYKSVGRGAALDLGLSPNRDGVIDADDVAKLKAFGELLKQTFAVNLAKDAAITASNIRGKNSKLYGTKFLTDADRFSYWATDDKVNTPTLTLSFKKPVSFNVIQLRENIKLGQRIEEIAVDAYQNGEWKQVATATSIGSKRLIRLPQNITASKVRLRIVKSPVSIALSDFGLYKEPVHVTAPIISKTSSGEVTISTDAPVSNIYYTLDGSTPTKASTPYGKPFVLTDGGAVKAIAIDGDVTSEAANVKFSLNKKEWKILNAANNDAAQAIDENYRSVWSTLQKDTSAAFKPTELAVDMGEAQIISIFTYLPRQDKKTEGIVDRYTFYVSDNGTDWKEATKGEFSNIKANPVEQEVKLNTPIKARYFKFQADHVVSGNGVVVAEVGVRSK
ncbi:alpha-L-fucosidase [Mucilaginibacter sp. UR6-1]|uniref:alpha-L-fucosidase n=1 Tax=Mucilaginibacter sp. UR6-1 TaxID=1435643 RepID=UPI001E442F5B|nr:alpha-L-fucosidase [Mucilaginibacter sp. UR6-1]MCC8408278.1 alpha-L-fucosidase [Mucilaginibacter sp. UR6-1]